MKKDESDGSFWSILWREGLAALTLGWELAIPIFGGVLLGYALDRWLGTRHVFTLGLLTMGIGIGFYNIWRFGKRMDALQRRMEAEKKQKDQTK